MNNSQETDLPFVPLKGISFAERGRLSSQNCVIEGIKVCFKLGNLHKEKADAVFIPHSPKNASKRSVNGHFVRSDYHEDAIEIEKIMKEREAEDLAPFSYGDVISTPIKANSGQTDFGTPSYFFHGFTVTGQDEADKQFNAVREAVRKAGWAAIYLQEEGVEITTIALPAIGTGPAGHLKGYQSARAIFAGIHDLGKEIAGKGYKVNFNIVIKDDARHGPMIDEFLKVKNDLSYLNVPPEGEVGKKKFNPEAYVDHINLENLLNEAYMREREYSSDYPSYDM